MNSRKNSGDIDWKINWIIMIYLDKEKVVCW